MQGTHWLSICTCLWSLERFLLLDRDCDGQPLERHHGVMSRMRLVLRCTGKYLHNCGHYIICRLQELEDLERRGQGIKTKMETQAKYGW